MQWLSDESIELMRAFQALGMERTGHKCSVHQQLMKPHVFEIEFNLERDRSN